MSIEKIICQGLDRYLAEEFDEKQRSEFEAHLSACATCSEEVEIDRNLDVALSQLPESVAIPASLDSVYSTHIQKARQKARQKSFYSRSLLAAVAIVLLGFFSIFVFNHEKPNEEINDGQIEQGLNKVASAVGYKIHDPLEESGAHVVPKKQKKTIVVEYPTENKNITVVFLYPERTSPRRRYKLKKETSL